MEQVWNCQVSRKTEDPFQASIDDLTVGEIFYLKCNNTVNEETYTQPDQKGSLHSLETKQPQPNMAIFLKQHPWPQYVLKSLKTLSVSDKHVLLEVTSYIPGNYNATEGLFLQKGNHIIPIKGISWNAISSFSKNSQQQMTQLQPHPIYGFVKIPSPYLEIVFWVVSFLAILTTIFFIVRKIKKRKNEFNDIENLKTLRSPLYELYHEVKKIERKYLNLSTDLNHEDPIKLSQEDSQTNLSAFYRELNKIFRKFLAVQLVFPAHLWSTQKSLKYLKKRYFDPELLKYIKSILNELNQMASIKGAISQEDCHKNLSFCKDIANQIANLQKRKDF